MSSISWTKTYLNKLRIETGSLTHLIPELNTILRAWHTVHTQLTYEEIEEKSKSISNTVQRIQNSIHNTLPSFARIFLYELTFSGEVFTNTHTQSNPWNYVLDYINMLMLLYEWTLHICEMPMLYRTLNSSEFLFSVFARTQLHAYMKMPKPESKEYLRLWCFVTVSSKPIF